MDKVFRTLAAIVLLAGSTATRAGGIPCTSESLADVPVHYNVDFQSQVQPIFSVACANCHTNGGAFGGLNLDVGAAHGNLVGVIASNPAAALSRVQPGSGAQSFLFAKINCTDLNDLDDQPYGLRMPRNGPPYLDPVDQALILDWIEQGASLQADPDRVFGHGFDPRGGNAGAAMPLFADTFVTGDLSSGNAHFAWQNFNRTSVITVDPAPAVLAGYQFGQNMSDRDWDVISGSNALRVTYLQEWAEQRFALPQGRDEVWFQFDLRVPTNFSHQSQGAGIPSNSKVFYVWMDGYSQHGLGPTIGWEYWQGGGGVSRLAMNIGQHSASLHTGHIQHFDFINANSDRGRWMTLRFHLKVGSGPLTPDGVVSMWRRWHGEAAFTRHHHKTDAVLGNSFGGFQAGYLMGWHNGLYTEEQDWLIDNFQVWGVEPP